MYHITKLVPNKKKEEIYQIKLKKKNQQYNHTVQ